jgi:cation transport ATPase
MSSTARFRVQGMDCASCVAKIETAVRRVEGVGDVKVGLQSETLTVGFTGAPRNGAVERAVRSRGFRVAPLTAGGSSTPAGSANDSPASDHGDSHDDHTRLIDGAWWRSAKGRVVVRPGDRVPADGAILSGSSALDESALTGESIPRDKQEGDTVLAGSINIDAVLRVRVDQPADDTLIARVVPLGSGTAEDVLRLAAAVEWGSSHPLAQAVVAAAQEQSIVFTPVASRVLPGKGIAGRTEKQMVTIGAPARRNMTAPEVLARAAELEAQGKSVSVVLSGRMPVGLIAMRDEPRADAVDGIRAVKALGVRPVMLTGDNRANAEAVGRIVGMEVRAELIPEDKLAVIRQRAGAGGIAKVGDGINDAPALAAATVGIAMGSGTDVALEAADAAVLNNRISDVAGLIRLSRQTLAVIRQNVILALGVKSVFLVTTIAGATGLWIAVLADTAATVLVKLNALRLLRHR